jgi:hypothetical protein
MRKPLTAAFANSISNPGKYNDTGRLGLFLLVQPSGTKSWVQRVSVRGRRRDLGLGAYPVVTLAEARSAALENKRLAISGKNPVIERKKQHWSLTFEQAANLAYVEHAPILKNEKDRRAYQSTMERYIFPRFGQVQLNEVTSRDIRQAILEAREQAPAVARKLIYRVSNVFRWGIAEGHCDVNPAIS